MFLEMMTQMRRNVIYSMFMFQPRLDPEPESITPG
jgi:preprotein translocase subunit SecA